MTVSALDESTSASTEIGIPTLSFL